MNLQSIRQFTRLDKSGYKKFGVFVSEIKIKGNVLSISDHVSYRDDNNSWMIQTWVGSSTNDHFNELKSWVRKIYERNDETDAG